MSSGSVTDPIQDRADLDEYLSRRMDQNHGAATDHELDVYTQLANKENDLMLAAELGKALLEKNEELERVHNQMHDEYQVKMEVSVGITVQSA